MGAREELAAIRERAEAATEGPWEHVERRFDGGRVREHSVETHAHVIADDLSLNSAEFIAHARTDVPRLVAALGSVLDLADRWDRLADLDGEKDPAGWRMRSKAKAVREAVTAALTTDAKGDAR